jgi:hypothetical protein
MAPPAPSSASKRHNPIVKRSWIAINFEIILMHQNNSCRRPGLPAFDVKKMTRKPAKL